MYIGNLRDKRPSQGWTGNVGRSNGQKSTWTFEEFRYVIAETILTTPYCRHSQPEPATDPDIFLLEAGIEGADSEIAEALQDAVQCLRQELYRPAVTMLGKAMEGSWIELGLGLATALPNDPGGTREREKIEKQMKDDNRGIAKKIGDVRSLYNQKDITQSVIKTSGVRPEELESAVIWSDVVREARNAIHFGPKPTTANSYDKVVVLFLAGARNLKMMYRINKSGGRVISPS